METGWKRAGQNVLLAIVAAVTVIIGWLMLSTLKSSVPEKWGKDCIFLSVVAAFVVAIIRNVSKRTKKKQVADPCAGPATGGADGLLNRQ